MSPSTGFVNIIAISCKRLSYDKESVASLLEIIVDINNGRVYGNFEVMPATITHLLCAAAYRLCVRYSQKMFFGATSFNSDLNSWNVARASNMIVSVCELLSSCKM